MKKLLLFVLLQSILLCATAQLKVTSLLCENLSNPNSLDVKQPRFTWKLESDRRDVQQTAYEIRVSELPTFKNVSWTSGKTSSGQSVQVQYGGGQLASKLDPSQASCCPGLDGGIARVNGEQGTRVHGDQRGLQFKTPEVLRVDTHRGA